MKEKFKNFINVNWLFIFMVVVLQIKSTLLLSMLRTTDSASIDLSSAYFDKPVLWAHIAIIILVCSPILFFKEKGRLIIGLTIDVLITILFTFDLWYYRMNETFLSIRHLLHPTIFNPQNRSLINFEPIDIVFLIDFVILFFIHKFIKQRKIEEGKAYLRVIKGAVIFVLSAFVIWIGYYAVDLKQMVPGKNIFRLSWAPFQTFGDMSPLGYHGFDIAFYKDKEITLTDDNNKEIEKWFDDNKEDLPDNNYKGMLEGKNVIALQVESLENFVINQKVYGQEITPNLNKLLSSSLYFNNIHEQNNSGTSSDCDLMVNASVLPIREGTTVYSYPWSKYYTIQDILKNKGYTSISSHAELPGNWNWTEMHKTYGADKILDVTNFNQDEIIGLGLSDESYLNQIAEKLQSEKQPYYEFVTTLTSHGPFDLPEDKKYLDLPKELDDNMLGKYFQSVRYTDEAIGKFIKKLDEDGLLDNTVIMIYGDHCGVHKFYPDDIVNAPLEGDWWKDNERKIPYIIYSKGLNAETISKTGGQTDFKPTILYLLGIDRSEFEDNSIGRVLVNTNRDATILNEGQIVGNPQNDEEVNHLKDEFKISDYIIKGDYFKNYNK